MNNNFLLLFVLAHLTGDYILQTNKIAKMKSESLRGVTIHILMVGFVQVAMLSCYGIKGGIAGIIATTIHFGIDCLKLRIGRQFRKMELLLYLLDQGLHLLTLVLITLFLAPDNGWVEDYIPYIRLLTAVTLLFGMATVSAKTVARGFSRKIRNQSFFLAKERWRDTLTVTMIAVVVVLLALASLPLPIGLLISVLGVIPYGRLQKKAYGYHWQASLLKYVTLLVFTALAIWIGRILTVCC